MQRDSQPERERMGETREPFASLAIEPTWSRALAHLDALVVEDRLTRSEDEGPIYAPV